MSLKSQPLPGDTILVLRPIQGERFPAPPDRRLARLLKAALRNYGFHNVCCRDAKYGLEPARGPDGCTGPGCPACAAAAD